MFNPFFTGLSELTESELYTKAADLTRKYWATTNPGVRQQIKAMLDQIQSEQTDRTVRQKETPSDQDLDLDNLININ